MLRPDKPLGKFLAFIFDQMVLTVCFLVCAIPIVTLGASAIALYEQEYAILEGRDGNLIKDFLGGVYRNFVKGLELLGIGIVAAAVILSIWISLSYLGLPSMPVLAVLVIIIGGIFLWLLGLTGRYEQKMSIAFQNAFFLALRHLGATIILALLGFGYPVLFLAVPQNLLPVYMCFLLFFFWGIGAYLSSALLLRVLKEQQ
jgi:hypothetical protein